MAHLENFRLKVFRAVAEHLNFRKAAEQLFLTQPAVTLQIKALESDLGVRVFDRAGGKITLTRQGAVLLEYANKLANLASEADTSSSLLILDLRGGVHRLNQDLLNILGKASRGPASDRLNTGCESRHSVS